MEELTASREVEAVIFDVDGTLVASDPVHVAAFRWTLERYGYRLDPTPFLGLSTDEAFRRMVPGLSDDAIERLVAEKRERATELFGTSQILRPGAVQLLQDLSVDFRLALCSSGSRRTVDVAARQGLPLRCIEVTVTAEDCTQSKPHPEPYRRCLDLLSLRADQALAVEDTATGAQASHAAGIRTVFVDTADTPQGLPEGTTVVRGLDGVWAAIEYVRNGQ